MKIAFVSQPIDVVLPPFQNSVGACTYGAACGLEKSNEVTVFGMQQENQAAAEVEHRGVLFRFLPPTKSDLFFQRLRAKVSKIVQLSSPISTSRLLFPGYGRRVARELAAGNFDVIHIQHCSQYVPEIRRLNPRARIVLHLHAEWFSQSKPQKVAKRLDNLDLLTCVSDHIARKTRIQIPTIADRCETTYNGINDHEFIPEKEYKRGGLDQPLRIMYAGGISPHKGIHVLIEAFHLIAQNYPSACLEIIGPHGSYPIEETFDLKNKAAIKKVVPLCRPNLLDVLKSKALAGQQKPAAYLTYLQSRISPAIAGRIAFLGLIPRSELVQRYYDADVFVFPPVWDEGFGIPPVEAMAAGTAVVASRSGAVVETVESGVTGLLVEKNDPQSLATAISTLLSDAGRREQMGRAGRRRVLENFTWNQIASGMDLRYRQLREHSAVRPAIAQSWTLNIVRSLWLTGLLVFALAPWVLKFRLGINGPHHDAWHLISFFLTTIVLSDLTQHHRAGHHSPRSMLRSRLMPSLLAILAALLSEAVEVVRYHSHFEWHDILVDMAGIALACAFSWPFSRMRHSLLRENSHQ